MQMCVREARTLRAGACAPTAMLKTIVVGRPAAFQAFKPPAIEWTFL